VFRRRTISLEQGLAGSPNDKDMKSLWNAAAYPHIRDTDALPKDRPRNVAAVRRGVRISGEIGAPPSCCEWWSSPRRRRRKCQTANGKNRQKLPLSFVSLCSERLTETASKPYIGPLGCAAASARWRVREAPHCLHGDRASGHARGHGRVTASDAWGSAV
jgi:hypothetical protein